MALCPTEVSEKRPLLSPVFRKKRWSPIKTKKKGVPSGVPGSVPRETIYRLKEQEISGVAGHALLRARVVWCIGMASEPGYLGGSSQAF